MKQNKDLRLKELETGIKAAEAALSKIAGEGLYQWESVTVETDRQSEDKDEFLRKLSETLTAALAQNKKRPQNQQRLPRQRREQHQKQR